MLIFYKNKIYPCCPCKCHLYQNLPSSDVIYSIFNWDFSWINHVFCRTSVCRSCWRFFADLFLFMVLHDKKLFCFKNFSIKMHVSVSVLNFCYSCGCSGWNVSNGINEYSLFVGQKNKVRWGCWGLIICSMMQRLWWRWCWCCLAWCRIQRCTMKFHTHMHKWKKR